MSRTTVRIVTVAFLVALGLVGQRLVASTVVVGPSTCKSGYVHYSTIQSAVSTVPFNTIVMVCPGSYPEQVTITQPLTLEGVTDGTGSAAVISVPAAGLVQNASTVSFGAIAVQLLVQNAVGVTIKGLIVDGTGGVCPAGFVYPNRIVGIGVLNAGSANDGTSAVKVENVVVRNEQTCDGDGILADTSYATVSGSEIHDINQTAIDAYNAAYSITNNSIQRAQAYGIVLLNSSGASVVSGNNVSDSFNGILSTNTSNAATITNNTVLNSSYVGLWIYFSYHQTVTKNVVSNALWPLVVEGGFEDTLQNNTVSNAFYDGILDEVSFGGNTVTKNTVNEAPFGVFADSSTSGDSLVPNTFYNVVTTLDPGPPQSPTTPTATP